MGKPVSSPTFHLSKIIRIIELPPTFNLVENSELSGVELNNADPVYCLNPVIINAVCSLIADGTGLVNACREFYPIDETNAGRVDPSQLAMALAYARLCLDEPEMVTSRHLKMLRKHFTYEQIKELNGFIRKMIE